MLLDNGQSNQYAIEFTCPYGFETLLFKGCETTEMQKHYTSNTYLIQYHHQSHVHYDFASRYKSVHIRGRFYKTSQSSTTWNPSHHLNAPIKTVIRHETLYH